jgi:arylsulfate sulfotransferase
MKKKLVIAAFALVSIAAIAAGVIFSGVLVTPTLASLSKDELVPSRDILAIQQQREEDILADYAQSNYTLAQPYLIQDPYGANPLSALYLFETKEPAKISIQVIGKDAYTTFSYTNAVYATHHEIAVLGLYASTDNLVRLTAVYENGKTETSEQKITTEPLPFDFPHLKVEKSKPEQMEPGVDLMTACLDNNYTYWLDANGDVRGYFSDKNFGHCTSMHILKNGHLLATGDELKLMPYNMYNVWEMNLLGKVFVEYQVPNAVHHDLNELSNGDFLATSNNAAMPQAYNTREDVVIQIDRSTGQVVRQYDFRKILDENRNPYQHYDPGVLNAPNHDWAHLNSVAMDEADGSLIASSPIQSVVVKIDTRTSKIDWILGPHEGWDGTFSQYQAYLLKPIGENFEWQWGQHSVKILADTDNDPDTTDILLFDNGQARSFTQQNSVNPQDNYSRAVIYRVHESEKTIEQLWSYGKERGSEAYSTFLGSVEQLKTTGNINIMFGGMLRKQGVPVDDIVTGVMGKQEIHSRAVEVKRDGEVVFDVLVTPNNSSDAETYQVSKIDLYTTGIEYALGKSSGVRKGEAQSATAISYNLPKIFVPAFTFNFRQLYVKDQRLVLQGTYLYKGQSYMLGKVFFVLKNSRNQYVFPSNPGIGGNFAAVIDLSQLEPGDYAIYAAGGVTEGLDALGKILPGYNPTGYKVHVD